MQKNNIVDGAKVKKKKKKMVIELGNIDKDHSLHQLWGEEKQCLYTNFLTSREMESLTSLCDTFLPSSSDLHVSAADDKDVLAFFRSSASTTGTPERVCIYFSFSFI